MYNTLLIHLFSCVYGVVGHLVSPYKLIRAIKNETQKSSNIALASKRAEKMRTTFLLCIATLLITCSKKGIESSKESDLIQFKSWMTGTFSSAEQSAADSTFYSINMVITPIWLENQDAEWLYIEQALSTKLKEPYRQRIYKINQLADGSFGSEIYELPYDDRFIHGWETPSVFNKITPDSLVIREGCTVFLSKVKSNEYTGSTDTDKCKSTLYGASFATSKVQVFADKIISWDQGWDENNEQVWGAEKRGYIFERIK